MRVCAEDGCPEQIERGPYCPAHRRARRSPSNRVTSTQRWKRVRLRVLERDNWTCRYCGGPATTVDHVDPVVRGGDPFDERNLVAACKSCNSRKGAK